MEKTGFGFWEYVRSILTIIVFFITFLIFTPIILFLLLVSFGKASNLVVERIAPLMVRPAFWMSGIRFNVKYHTDSLTSPAVFIINHSSTLDVLTLLALGLPKIRFVAKWEFQYNPIFLILGRLTGQIFIKRQKSDKAIETLKKTHRRIHRDELSIMMAPEGSRKHPGIIGPFKKGPFRMAMDLNYPIVPIYFEGNRQLSKGGTMITKSGELTAHIHDAIDTSDWSLENLEEHIIEVRNHYLEWGGVENDDVEPIA
ncbi:lysophospholipid acyltransferase family protein [Fodinibius halophilus]|uniref:1-acyl-sn-glycerol-3-phosphate acyltransferase n=1 Tax=Fodinibius halophilus TaxID=1736908 RepID=A0A6M1T576_9BACT|nr:lysophospholipid acyltransferase family protein [Fodinibius halophilus]NGP89207.1 1-acyl-sn-glycerol-3-phosphate acyltransferase [Fodinibius halophilus]